VSQSAVVLRLTSDTAMRPWIFAALVFFSYVLVLAPLVPGLRRAARWRAILAALGGFALSLLSYVFDDSAVLRQWLMPPALLLVGYWASGQLFAAPMPGIERALCSLDRNLGVDLAIVVTPHWLRIVLELAYAGVYALVPIALLIRFATVAEPNPDGFWTIILVTDFVCFACLPWIQTRPPRALSAQPPWQSGLRRLNERVLASTSIQHNTFPSGHAAEAVACVLLVAAAPWPVLMAVAVAAALVSAGAVLGRYHYAADAVVGWVVAVAVWGALR
jgi:VanZ family protein